MMHTNEWFECEWQYMYGEKPEADAGKVEYTPYIVAFKKTSKDGTVSALGTGIRLWRNIHGDGEWCKESDLEEIYAWMDMPDPPEYREVTWAHGLRNRCSSN